MKKLKIVFLAVLLVSNAVVNAQEYAFKVLAHKGNNEIKSGGSWAALKTGATLQPGDEIKLGDNSYIGLVHSTGKPVEVKKPGVHTVSELETRVPAGSSVLHKYTDFILSSSDDGARNRLTATGAVTRTTTPAAPGSIKVFLPENTAIFNKTVHVGWEARANEGPYLIKVMNLFEDVLQKIETAESSYTIDLSDAKLANENAILIEIASKRAVNVVSKRHVIQKMSAADYDKIAGIVSNLKSDVQSESAINHVLLASFYEENKLLVDAIVAFERAKKLEPNAYDETYEEFMIRNNLK
jgi:hypothetical protein